MILLYNVYLDSKIRIDGLYFRGNYEINNTSVDVFKYTLSSVVNIYPWKKVIINVEFAENIEEKIREDLFEYIRSLFNNYNLLLNKKRCGYQHEWQELYELLDDDLIYFCCNHDHIFIDDNIVNFQNCINEFRSELCDSLASLYFSHWPEVNVMMLNNSPTIKKTFAYTSDNNIDSIQVITKKTYYAWWFTTKFPDMYLPRTDYFGTTLPYKPNKIQVVPYREYHKHFDGYTHIPSLLSNPNRRLDAVNISPPLFIPDGFFDNRLQLNFGYAQNLPNYININLTKTNCTVIDTNGTDLKCYADEIPYFWKNKIIHRDVNPIYNEKEYKANRNARIIDPLVCGHFHGRLYTSDVIQKIKETYQI